MQVNAKKCCIISFGRLFNLSENYIILKYTILPYAATHVDVVLTVSCSLKWDMHIPEKLGKANKAFYAIRRNGWGLSSCAKVNTYETMVLPIVTCASTCWFADMASLRRLESFQKRVIRWALGDTPYPECLHEAIILPISLYLQFLDLIFLSNLVHGRYDMDTSSLIQFETPTRVTRLSQSPRFLPRRPRLKLGEHNFWFRAPDLANRLPHDINYFTQSGLKSRLLRHLWSHLIIMINNNKSTIDNSI